MFPADTVIIHRKLVSFFVSCKMCGLGHFKCPCNSLANLHLMMDETRTREVCASELKKKNTQML